MWSLNVSGSLVSDMTSKEYKQFKGLKKENLRDNMTNKELVLNMLAELSTKEISETSDQSIPYVYNPLRLGQLIIQGLVFG